MVGQFNWIGTLTVAAAMLLVPVLPTWAVGPHFCSAQPPVRIISDRQEDQKEADEKHPLGFAGWDDQIRFGLSVELNGRYSNIKDEDDAASGDLWEAYIDKSVTLYEGQYIIENLEQFNTHQFTDGRRGTDRIDAYVLRFESAAQRRNRVKDAVYGLTLDRNSTHYTT
jgi:hypothetical protein